MKIAGVATNGINIGLNPNITTPNPILDLEVNKYNNVYKSNSIAYANNDLEVNKIVLHLIKWEVEYRAKHNNKPNRMTSKTTIYHRFTIIY